MLGLGFWGCLFCFGAGLFGTRPRFANAFKSSPAEENYYLEALLFEGQGFDVGHRTYLGVGRSVQARRHVF